MIGTERENCQLTAFRGLAFNTGYTRSDLKIDAAKETLHLSIQALVSNEPTPGYVIALALIESILLLHLSFPINLNAQVLMS